MFVEGIRRVCNKLSIHACTNQKVAELADFAKNLSFTDYGLFFVFISPSRPFAISCQVCMTTISYIPIQVLRTKE